MEKDYWEDFKRTGSVESYLKYKQTLNEEEEWTPLKQEASSQDGQTMVNQMQC